MNNLMIFEGHKVEKLKLFEDSNKNKGGGVFYIIEYDDNLIKIGSSTQPYTRYKQLKQNSKNYSNYDLGRIAVSKYHTNYVQNEHILHKYYEKYRRGSSELFYLSFSSVVQATNKLDMNFENKSKDNRKRSDAFINCIKYQILNYPDAVNDHFENYKIHKIEFNGRNYRIITLHDEAYFVLEDICRILELSGNDCFTNEIAKHHLKMISDGMERLIVIDLSGLYDLIDCVIHQRSKDVNEEDIVEAVDNLFIDICLHNGDKFVRCLFRAFVEKMKRNSWIIKKQKEALSLIAS